MIKLKIILSVKNLLLISAVIWIITDTNTIQTVHKTGIVLKMTLDLSVHVGLTCDLLVLQNFLSN